MKGRRVFALLFSALFLLSLTACARVYVIGRDVPFDDITEISLYSSGMEKDDCWAFTVTEEGITGDYTANITNEQWELIAGLFSGIEYRKMKKHKPEVLDGNSESIYIYWDGCPEGYEADLDIERFMEIKNEILSIVFERDDYDLENLIEVEYGYAGEDIGSYSSTSLRLKNNKWVIEEIKCEGNGYEEKKKTFEVSSHVMKNVKDIIDDYEWVEFKGLPLSEIQILDGGSESLGFTFSPYASWCLSDTQELTPEAIDMWKRIESEIEANMD